LLDGRAWDNHFHRLAVGSTVVRMGWFATLDPAVAIAITDRDDQVDLLVVAPQAPEAVAYDAMRQAADPTNTVRAPAIVAARTAASGHAPSDESGPAPPDEQDQVSAWDNEGGRPGPRTEAVLVG
jgi:hypothetical protein